MNTSEIMKHTSETLNFLKIIVSECSNEEGVNVCNVKHLTKNLVDNATVYIKDKQIHIDVEVFYKLIAAVCKCEQHKIKTYIVEILSNDFCEVEDCGVFIPIEVLTEERIETILSFCESNGDQKDLFNKEIKDILNISSNIADCETGLANNSDNVEVDNIISSLFKHQSIQEKNIPINRSQFIPLQNFEIDANYNAERPFICKVKGCRRAFKRLEHLKRHSRIHTGERPFKCTFPGCHKTFARTDNLSQHLRIHSNNTSFRMNREYEDYKQRRNTY